MILLIATAHAACDADNDQLEGQLDNAMSAFLALDKEGFVASETDVSNTLPCLQEPIRPELAAKVFRIHGLAGYLAKDTPAAQQAFASARRIDPSFRFPESVAPAGHPLEQDYIALDETAGGIQALPALSSGTFWINGRQSLQRSDTFPVIFQLQPADGEITTAWLNADQPLPLESADLVPVSVPTPEPVTTPPVVKKGPPTTLLWAGTGVLAAAAGGLFIANQVSRSDYNAHYDELAANPTPEGVDSYDRKRSTTNGLGFAAGGVAIGAAGLGATAVITGAF